MIEVPTEASIEISLNQSNSKQPENDPSPHDHTESAILNFNDCTNLIPPVDSFNSHPMHPIFFLVFFFGI
jgi:hypothetical protein